MLTAWFTEGQALRQRAAVADARQVQPQRGEAGRRQRPGQAHMQAMRSDPMDHARIQQRDGWPLLPRDFASRFGEDGDDATGVTGERDRSWQERRCPPCMAVGFATDVY